MAKSESSDFIQPIYKQRALKHLIKVAGGKSVVKGFDADQLSAMQKARTAIAKDMQFNALKWFRPFPYQLRFFETGKTSSRRGMLAANRSGKCCTAATVLDLPNGKKITYGEMYAKGESFDVWSWDGEKAVIKTAIQPIKKPQEPCVRLWMSDGRWIEPALHHRVLDSKGNYVFCSTLLASLHNLQDSTSEHDQLARASGVQRLKKKLQGFLGDCLSKSRLYGAQLLKVANNVQSFFQQQADALRHDDSLCNADGLDYKYTNNLSYKYDHLSIQYVGRHVSALFAESLGHALYKTSLLCLDCIQVFQRLSIAAILGLQSKHELSQNPKQSSLALLNPWLVAANKIVAYEPIGCHDVYDFTVPGTENYISCGIVHHNTIASTYEAAMHLTGRYPKWWKGKVFDQPIICMVSGESWEQVAKALQSKLLGVDDIKQGYKIGTGSIPRDAIDEKSIRTDGANVLAVEIRHTSGGKSKLYFSNYTQQVRHLQGFELDLVVLDEQPPDETFSELVTRTAARNGQLICSFTPLKGMSGLVRRFWDEIKGYTHVRVTWDDVPYENEWGEKFFSKEEREQLSRDYMPWERECRINGIPLVGKGVVFPMLKWPTYKSTDVDLKNNDSLERLISFDLGIKNDPTVISFLFRDPVEEIIWLHRQITVPTGETPDEYVHYLMDRETKGVPIALPHDATQAGRYTLTEQSVREVFEDNYGLNCIPGAILNPANDQGKVTNHKSYGINIIRLGMERGSFRINEACTEFLDEARNYAIDEQGRFIGKDDHIDSARMGILALIQGHGESVVSRANTFAFRRPAPIEGRLQRI
jgi:phage terminase large subunit-like protein